MKEIFKYMSRKRGIQTLQSSNMFLPSPVDFDDKKDCSFQGFSYVGKNTIVERLRDILVSKQYYRQLVINEGWFRGSPSSWRGLIGKILDERRAYNPFLYDKIWTLIPRLIEGIKNFDPGDYEWSARKLLKVLCLCLDDNNTYLWENYAHGNTGLVIGLNLDKLEQMPYSKVLKVKYSSVLPSYELGKMTKEIAEAILGTKLLEFEPEQETRIVFDTTHEKRLAISDLVTSVIFGAKFDFTCVPVKEWLRKYPHACFYMTDPQNNTRTVITPDKE